MNHYTIAGALRAVSDRTGMNPAFTLSVVHGNPQRVLFQGPWDAISRRTLTHCSPGETPRLVFACLPPLLPDYTRQETLSNRGAVRS